MQYAEFIELRRRGEVEAGISTNLALRLGEYLPARCQYAVAFWNVIGFATLLGGIVAIFLVKWWIGILVVVFVAPLIFAANKRSVVKHVLTHAEENEEFFNFLVSKGWLVFRR